MPSGRSSRERRLRKVQILSGPCRGRQGRRLSSGRGWRGRSHGRTELAGRSRDSRRSARRTLRAQPLAAPPRRCAGRCPSRWPSSPHSRSARRRFGPPRSGGRRPRARPRSRDLPTERCRPSSPSSATRVPRGVARDKNHSPRLRRRPRRCGERSLRRRSASSQACALSAWCVSSISLDHGQWWRTRKSGDQSAHTPVVGSQSIPSGRRSQKNPLPAGERRTLAVSSRPPMSASCSTRERSNTVRISTGAARP